jgi:opacity protein-like surface antigen
MKKIMAVAVMVLAMAGSAFAAPKMVPEGTVVSAVISGSVATVTIQGVKPLNVEFYSYEGVKELGGVSQFTLNLREGRRFNFTFGPEAYYALLTPDMYSWPPDFVGSGIKIDCSDPRGCAFIIVPPATKR